MGNPPADMGSMFDTFCDVLQRMAESDNGEAAKARQHQYQCEAKAARREQEAAVGFID